MTDAQKPRLIVVAGPNGSGKTTITEKLLRHKCIEECQYKQVVNQSPPNLTPNPNAQPDSKLHLEHLQSAPWYIQTK